MSDRGLQVPFRPEALAKPWTELESAACKPFAVLRTMGFADTCRRERARLLPDEATQKIPRRVTL